MSPTPDRTPSTTCPSSSSQLGILLWGDGSTTISLTVTGSSAVLDGGSDGIFVRHATLTMDGGLLAGNAGSGLSLQDESAATLSGVEIAGNATSLAEYASGVLASANGANGQTVTLNSCHVHGNLGPGVEAHSHAGSFPTAYINNSEIDSNAQGIFLFAEVPGALSTTALVVDGGSIHDNADDGILVQAALWHLTTLDLEGTLLQNNPGSGVGFAQDETTGGPLDGGSFFTLHGVTCAGNGYGLRFEGSPNLVDLSATGAGALNQLTGNLFYQISDERPQDTGVIIDASGAVLALDGGTWPQGMLETGPVTQAPVYRIVTPNNAIQF